MADQCLFFRVINEDDRSLHPYENIECIIFDTDDSLIGDPILLKDLISVGRLKTVNVVSILFVDKGELNKDWEDTFIDIEFYTGRQLFTSSALNCYRVYEQNIKTKIFRIAREEDIDYMEILLKGQYLLNTFVNSR